MEQAPSYEVNTLPQFKKLVQSILIDLAGAPGAQSIV